MTTKTVFRKISLVGLKFKKSKLEKELNFCNDLARTYFDRGSKDKLKDATRELNFIYNSNRTSYAWQIDKDHPLKTTPNCGKPNLQGRLSFIWNLKKCDDDTLELVEGKASTVVAIHEIADSGVIEKPAIKWHVDVVTSKNAPGPAFHTQIKNPRNLPVPRLPSFLFSPVDCLDLLLGELFQEKWKRHQSNHIDKTRKLAKIQNPRFCRLITEQQKALEETGSNYSAWIAFKNWEPADDIFL